MKKSDKIQKENPFKVPDNYFEDVTRKIFSATSGNNLKARKFQFYNRFRTQIAIAASFAGIILLSYTAVKLLTPGKSINQMSEVINNENLDLYIEDIDLLTLEENMASIALPEEASEINNSDIINYLLSENIEIYDIYEII